MALREQVLRGGLYLSVRQGVSLGAGVVGILLLTRLIGPTNYGLYRGALEIVAFFAGVAQWGLSAFLIRREEDPPLHLYDQVFTLLLVGSLGFMALGFLLDPLLAYWLGDARYLAPFRVMLLSLPLTVLSAPAVARLERRLDYSRIAVLETSGQILYHGTAVLLAWLGWGFWAPVAGYVLWQAWMTVASWYLARYRPRLVWSFPIVREMVRYGAGYSASFWIYNLRLLVNPIIVGRFLGPAYVGYVALSIRLIEMLGFAKNVGTRISLAALAKVQLDTPRLRRVVSEAVGLQAVALGAPLAAFALISPLVVHRLFGPQWDPSLLVYPFIAAGLFGSALFSMHVSVLYVMGRNGQVITAYAIHVVLFAATTAILVPTYGILGYGLGEIAGLGGWWALHFLVSRRFEVSYRRAFPWLAAFVPALFAPLVDPPANLVLLVPLSVTLVSKQARGQIREYWRLFRQPKPAIE